MSNLGILKARIKKHLKNLRQSDSRTFHSFTPNDLQRSLRRLGIESGDIVIVHSSFDAFEGFTGKPSDVISALKEAIGSKGTLLMPTLPFTGTAVEYVKEHPIFDVRR